MKRNLYNWIVRCNLNDSIYEAGGIMIASNAKEVLNQLTCEYPEKDFECKIRRSDMALCPEDTNGIIIDTLWNHKLSINEINNGICGNDVCQKDLKDLIFISNHPVKEHIVK